MIANLTSSDLTSELQLICTIQNFPQSSFTNTTSISSKSNKSKSSLNRLELAKPFSNQNLGSYVWAPSSINKKRSLDEDSCDEMIQVCNPYKKTQVKSNDDALQLHLSIYNNKVVSGASIFGSPSKNSDYSLPYEFSDTCLATLRGSSNFCSQMTRADSNLDLNEADRWFSESEDSINFASISSIKKTTSQMIFSSPSCKSIAEEDDLECDEDVDLKLKNASQKVVQVPCGENNSSNTQEISLILQAWENHNNKNNSSEKDYELLENLHNQSSVYVPNPNCLANQAEITQEMRAILVDYMMEVSRDLHLKRETLYIAVNYLDRYLSTVPNVPRWDLQKVGITSLYVASKMEEVKPQSVQDFAKATDDGYTSEQILAFETHICKVLKWRMTPVTMYTLANSYMTFWDKFSSTALAAADNEATNNGINFKHHESYGKFRELVQILDLILLNPEALKFSQSTLVAALIYLVIGKHSELFTIQQIINNNAADLDNQNIKEFNNIFETFLRDIQGPSFASLIESIEFLCPYFAVQFSYELPQAVQTGPLGKFKSTYEEFLSFQTHSPSNLPFLQERLNWE